MSNNQQWEQLKEWIKTMGEYEKIEISVASLETATKAKKLKVVRRATDAFTFNAD